MKDISVSVIIPTYNRGYVIRQAIESALRQSYQNFDIIIVDDGSRDDTAKLIAEFNLDKISCICHDENRGCSAAYNSGILAATGDLLAFLDSDDEWKPDYLERQVRFLRTHPEIDGVFCDTEILTPNGSTTSLLTLLRAFPKLLQSYPDQSECVISARHMYLCLLEEIPIKPTGAMVRREVLRRVGLFDEASPSGTDWELFLRMSHRGPFGYIRAPLAIQRRSPDATHQLFRREDKTFLLSILLREKAGLRKDWEGVRAANRGLANLYNSLAWACLEAGKDREAFAVYVHGFLETHSVLLFRKTVSASLRITCRTVKRVFLGSNEFCVEPAIRASSDHTAAGRCETDLVVSMARNIVVSIVMPTYNRGYIIREAIDSALRQTYKAFEIIIVDDGSSDDTKGIVAQFADTRIRYICHERNRGYSAACNTGILAAAGDLVAFLDSDDLWKHNYLEHQVAFFRTRPYVGVVFCDSEVPAETGDLVSLMSLLQTFPKLLRRNPDRHEYVISSRRMYLCLLEEVPVKPTAAVVNRRALQRVGLFNESWPSGTDWDLFLRLARRNSFGYIHVPLATQRRTRDATHQKFREEDKLFLLSIFLKEKAGLQGDRDALSAVNRGIVEHSNGLAWSYVESGRRIRAMSVYWRAFRETGSLSMLWKALAWSWVPLPVRAVLRRHLKRPPARLARDSVTF